MGLMSPVMREALRARDPYPNDLLALDFAGVATGGRQFYKREGIIVPRFEMLSGALSTGHAGFGTQQVNTAWRGFPANAPLIGDGGLGVWEARTNQFARSLDFSNAVWSVPSGATKTLAADVVAPNGLSSCFVLKAANTAFGGYLRQGVTYSGSTTYALSFIVKKKNHRYVGLRMEKGVLGVPEAIPFYDFDTDALSNNGVSGASISRELLPNGWVRLSLVYTTSASPTTAADLWLTNSLGQTGPALSGTEEIYVWHGQVEAGAFASPPIFTEATAATRTAVAQSVGGLVLPSGDFDIEQTFRLGPSGVTSRAFEYHNGTDAERILCNVSTGGSLSAFVVVGGGSATQIGASSSPLAPGAEARVSVRRRGSNWQFIVNEAQSGGDTAAGAPSVNAVIFGQRRINTEVLNSTIQRHRVRAA